MNVEFGTTTPAASNYGTQKSQASYASAPKHKAGGGSLGGVLIAPVRRCHFGTDLPLLLPGGLSGRRTVVDPLSEPGIQNPGTTCYRQLFGRYFFGRSSLEQFQPKRLLRITGVRMRCLPASARFPAIVIVRIPSLPTSIDATFFP